MNKTTTTIIALGVIIIAVIAYILVKPKAYAPVSDSYNSPQAIKQAQFDITDPGTFTPLSGNLTLYVNQYDHFEVSYPSNWTVDTQFEGREDGIDTLALEDNKNKYQGRVDISVGSAEDCDTVTSCVKAKDDTLPTVPFVIGGVTVQAYTQSTTDYEFIYNKKFYNIDFQPSGTNNVDYPAFQNMLASFKFI